MYMYRFRHIAAWRIVAHHKFPEPEKVPFELMGWACSNDSYDC